MANLRDSQGAGRRGPKAGLHRGGQEGGAIRSPDRAPGIADDGRGLAVILGVIDALDHGGVETEGPITFVGTVGEEGLGDLRQVLAAVQVAKRLGATVIATARNLERLAPAKGNMKTRTGVFACAMASNYRNFSEKKDVVRPVFGQRSYCGRA